MNQDVVPQHHSNIWHIWATIADYSTGKDYEELFLRLVLNVPRHVAVDTSQWFLHGLYSPSHS